MRYNAGFSSLKSNSFEQSSVVQRMKMDNDYISRISTKVGKTEKDLIFIQISTICSPIGSFYLMVLIL